ncbi:quinol:cytochrome C oxidoreductase [Gaoshiqia sp. Z1-71]|uniref:quinol:cytochrome C oxidoreductase n=1 Tax=Gaoshiqia hydrogeniformans TaxID=3290090 RepID=UPI003BF83FFC
MENHTFKLTKKFSTIAVAMIAIGLITLGISLVSGTGGERLAANLLLNTYYFLAIGLIGLFIVAAHTIAESGWHTSIQRIGEAMSTFIPVAGLLLLLLFVFGGVHLLYEWTHEDHLDEILLKKVAYLNVPFFYGRFLVYFFVWISLAYFIRKNSVQLDLHGDLKYYRKMRILSAIFVVALAVTSVTSAWDWLMSIDAHWFSTLYGWYVFSSMLASGTAVLIVILFILQRMGYMNHINREHIHDLGKYLFGFSIFWTYLWFSQYMLIWYANIPEETIYFYERHKHFSDVFYINLILNFIIPFFALMTRNSKRGSLILLPVAVIVFIGHWLDLYQLIMPGAVGGEKAGIGLPEIGLTIGYAGLFLLVVFRSLTKAPLVPARHPFYKESLEYHTQY